jgi:hypothetical protein
VRLITIRAKLFVKSSSCEAVRSNSGDSLYKARSNSCEAVRGGSS